MMLLYDVMPKILSWSCENFIARDRWLPQQFREEQKYHSRNLLLEAGRYVHYMRLDWPIVVI
jgi:hypothetical protein